MNPTKWFEIILLYTVLTLLSVYFIPADSAVSVFRNVLGYVFVAFLPGYCLVSFLFVEGKLDLAEKAVLSVALSFAIAGISGLFLGLSPIGISTVSITVTLSVMAMVLALLAFLRKKGLIKVQSPRFHIRKPSKMSDSEI